MRARARGREDSRECVSRAPPLARASTPTTHKEVPELEEGRGGHGLEDGDLLDEHALDLAHAAEARDGEHDELVVDGRRREDAPHTVDLVQHLLEPQLVAAGKGGERMRAGRRSRFG